MSRLQYQPFFDVHFYNKYVVERIHICSINYFCITSLILAFLTDILTDNNVPTYAVADILQNMAV